MTALARAALALGLAVVLFGRPWAHGIPLSASGLFWAFVLVHVALPGMALCWATQRFRYDAGVLVGQGLSLGLVVQAVGYFAARALGMPEVASATTLVVTGVSLAVGCRRRRPRAVEPAAELGSAPPHLLLALVLLGCALYPLFSERHLGSPIPVDLLFHSGNAGEVGHRWPLQTPRIAGIPLKYQVLVYAAPAGAARWSGAPIADVLLALAPLLWISLVVLQVYNAGRALFRDPHVGLLAAAVVVCHADPGPVLGLGAGAFNSYFSTGLYESPTTVCGFILLASLTLTLGEWFSDEGWRWRTLVPLGLLSLGASAAKASVLPTVAGGLATLALWAWFRRPDLVGRTIVALAVIALCGVPVTLWLSTGEGSYHAMLQWGLGAAMKRSAFALWLGRVTGLGSPPTPWLTVAAALPWLLGYLGLVGVGFLVWITGRRPRLQPLQVWALGLAATGTALGLSFDAFGLSQLFFFYSGQLILAAFAGAGIVMAVRQRRPLAMAWVLASSLPSLLFATTRLVNGHRADRRAHGEPWTEAQSRYAAGLRWLRTHAAEGSVILADNPSLYLTAFGECRTFYETGLYSPLGDLLWGASADQAYADRVSLQERLLRRPDREAVAAVEARFPPGTTLRIVADSVQTRLDEGVERAEIGLVPGRLLFSPELFELEFANAAMHVYRVRPQTSRGRDLPSNRATP